MKPSGKEEIAWAGNPMWRVLGSRTSRRHTSQLFIYVFIYLHTGRSYRNYSISELQLEQKITLGTAFHPSYEQRSSNEWRLLTHAHAAGKCIIYPPKAPITSFMWLKFLGTFKIQWFKKVNTLKLIKRKILWYHPAWQLHRLYIMTETKGTTNQTPTQWISTKYAKSYTIKSLEHHQNAQITGNPIIPNYKTLGRMVALFHFNDIMAQRSHSFTLNQELSESKFC